MPTLPTARVWGVGASCVAQGGSSGAASAVNQPVVVNLDLRGATVGVDDLIDKVAAGLDARNRRLGVLT